MKLEIINQDIYKRQSILFSNFLVSNIFDHHNQGELRDFSYNLSNYFMCPNRTFYLAVLLFRIDSFIQNLNQSDLLFLLNIFKDEKAFFGVYIITKINGNTIIEKIQNLELKLKFDEAIFRFNYWIFESNVSVILSDLQNICSTSFDESKLQNSNLKEINIDILKGSLNFWEKDNEKEIIDRLKLFCNSDIFCFLLAVKMCFFDNVEQRILSKFIELINSGQIDDLIVKLIDSAIETNLYELNLFLLRFLSNPNLKMSIKLNRSFQHFKGILSGTKDYSFKNLILEKNINNINNNIENYQIKTNKLSF